MKLKTMLLIGLFLIPFFSCENREEFSVIDLETELVAEIMVTAEPADSPELKSLSTEKEYSFTGKGIFCLAQNKELGKPMCTVQNIKPCTGCKLSFTGVGEEGSILSMQLKWGSKNIDDINFDMQDEIDLSSLTAINNNGNLEFDLTGVIDPVVNCIDCNPNCMYLINITGTTDFSLPSQARLIIPVSAEKKVYNVPFSVF